MAQYIDKTKIEEILRSLWKEDDGSNPEHRICYNKALQEVQCQIDVLEVKEVDLDKFIEKINTFQGRYKYPEITSIKGAMAFMARMFYSYPNVAREWCESLPKATMD